jgi:hypothetical protein
MRSLCVVLVAFALALAFSPAARADYDPVGSGATTLKLDRSFLALMKANRVKLTAVAPARLKAGAVVFPARGGKFDSLSSRGTVEHEGALRFQSAGGKVPLKALQLKTTQPKAPFSAKAGGGQLKIATAGGLRVSRAGFGAKVKVTKLALSDKLATKLGKKLALKQVFDGGMALGSASTRVNPETITVVGEGKVALNLDPAFLAKLNSLFVAVNPIFPAEHPGAFELPIFGGAISPDASAGRLETKGSLEFLQLSGGQVFWHEAWMDLDIGGVSVEPEVQPAPPYAGRVGRSPTAALSLAGAIVSANATARTISVQNASLALDAGAATTFNEAFAERKEVFRGGETLGSLSFVAQGQ